MVASWACEVTNPQTKEASSVLLCVRISGTSQAQLANITVHLAISVVEDTL